MCVYIFPLPFFRSSFATYSNFWNTFHGGIFFWRKGRKKRRKVDRFGGWKRRVSDRSVHICLFAFNLAKEERSDPPSVHKPINLSRNWVIVVVRYLIGPIFSPHRGWNIFASSPGTEDPIQFFQFLFVVEEKKEKMDKQMCHDYY